MKEESWKEPVVYPFREEARCPFCWATGKNDHGRALVERTFCRGRKKRMFDLGCTIRSPHFHEKCGVCSAWWMTNTGYSAEGVLTLVVDA